MHKSWLVFLFALLCLQTIWVQVSCGEDEKAVAPKSGGKGRRDLTNQNPVSKYALALYYNFVYKKINNYLVDGLPENTGVEANIEFAKSYLGKLSRQSVIVFDRFKMEALRRFIALEEITDTNSCNRNSYIILLNNHRATRGRAHRPGSEIKAPRRIDSVVYQVAKKHADRCLPLYPTKFNELYNKLDPNSKNLAESFTNLVLNEYSSVKSSALGRGRLITKLRPDLPIYIHELKRGLKKIPGKTGAKIAYKFLLQKTTADPNRRYLARVIDEKNGKLMVEKTRVSELLNNYIVNPCRHYVETLGPEAYIPARYDAFMVERQEKYEIKGDTKLFFEKWVNFWICRALISNVSSITSHLDNIVAKEPKH